MGLNDRPVNNVFPLTALDLDLDLDLNSLLMMEGGRKGLRYWVIFGAVLR